MKKLFFVSLSLFLVSLGLFLFSKFNYLFNGSQADLVVNKSDVSETKEAAPKEEKKNPKAKFLEIASKGVAGAALYADGSQIIFYQNQKFLVSDFNGESKNSLAAYPFLSVEEIVWGKEGKKALVKSKGVIIFLILKKMKQIS